MGHLSLRNMTPEDQAIAERLPFWLNDAQDRWIMERLTKRHYLAEPVCPECGSSEFYNTDGSCYWDMAAQDWLVSDVYPQRGFCGDCDYESYSDTVYYKREDIDGMNADRSEWARQAVEAFQCAVGTDDEDAVGDLLCNLMHFCYDTSQDFSALVERARKHYTAEIQGERVTRPIGDPSLRENAA